MKITRYKLLTLNKWLTTKLIQTRIINQSYSRKLELYRMVLDYMELHDVSKNKAVESIKDIMDKSGRKVSRMTVWNAVKEMEDELEV